MKSIIPLCVCAICTITLSISCDYFFSERVKIEVTNKSNDNIFILCFIVQPHEKIDLTYPYVWDEVCPQDTVIASELEVYGPDDEFWTIWIVNKEYMGDWTIKEVVEHNLFDSVRTYNHTYSYQDLQSMNFLIEVDESFWE
jgi:hypothetical protein